MKEYQVPVIPFSFEGGFVYIPQGSRAFFVRSERLPDAIREFYTGDRIPALEAKAQATATSLRQLIADAASLDADVGSDAVAVSSRDFMQWVTADDSPKCRQIAPGVVMNIELVRDAMMAMFGIAIGQPDRLALQVYRSQMKRGDGEAREGNAVRLVVDSESSGRVEAHVAEVLDVIDVGTPWQGAG